MNTPLPTKYFIVYADFNCPFCYALNELIHALNLEAQVEWRSIQHAVNASSSLCSFESLSELASEVSEVRRRTPATEIRVPVFRPHSASASRIVAMADRVDREKAAQLRRSIYRALWVDAEDISKTAVLHNLLRVHDLVLPPIDSAVEEELSTWQNQWKSTDHFERNIPITLDESGATMIGLPSQSELEKFLLSGARNVVSEMHAVCAMKPRQRILLLDSDVESVRVILEQMRSYQVEVASDSAEFDALITKHGLPDLILLDTSTSGIDSEGNWYQCLKNSMQKGEVPVILMSSDTDPQVEVAAFESGVVDFFVKPFHPRVLKARLTLHLDKCNAEKMLVHQARYDSLTGIPNRRAFNMQLQTEWDRAIRSRSSLGLLMIDVDYFKAYNDNYGHTQGDDCLAAVARVLERCIKRPGDFLSRFGGEEFVIMLPETDQRGVLYVAERCRTEINTGRMPHDYSDIATHLTVSIGYATCQPEQGRSINDFIEMVDSCLYEAKRQGRNRVCG